MDTIAYNIRRKDILRKRVKDYVDKWPKNPRSLGETYSVFAIDDVSEAIWLASQITAKTEKIGKKYADLVVMLVTTDLKPKKGKK